MKDINFSDCVFYHIYPLGFCDALYKNDYEKTPIMRFDKFDNNWIEHIKNLGVNAIYFGPIFESTYHGYDTADYFIIDRRLGSNDLFKNLVKKLHTNDIKVIIDGVFNHVGRDFWAFKDVLINGQSSPYVDWFYLYFDYKSPYNDNFSYECWEGYYDLVKLNLQNNDVIEHLTSAVSYWINKFDIDGIRFDVAYCIEPSFLSYISNYCKSLKKNFWTIGEIVHGDYRQIANETMLDSATNYECYKGLYSSHNDNNYYEIAYSLNRLFGENGIYKHLSLYNFADNHDVNRVATSLKNPAHLYTLYTLLFTMPGIPSIYYGSEWGIEGNKDSQGDEVVRPSIDLLNIMNEASHKDLLHTIKLLSDIRKKSSALKKGEYQQLYVSNEQLVYIRKEEHESILVALNLSDKTVELDIQVPIEASKFIDLLNPEESFNLENNQRLHFHLYPTWGRILKVE